MLMKRTENEPLKQKHLKISEIICTTLELLNYLYKVMLFKYFS